MWKHINVTQTHIELAIKASNKGGANSVSKNHINYFRSKERTQKLASCTFLSWSWQPFPFYYVDARGRVFPKPAVEALRASARPGRSQARPGRGHAGLLCHVWRWCIQPDSSNTIQETIWVGRRRKNNRTKKGPFFGPQKVRKSRCAEMGLPSSRFQRQLLLVKATSTWNKRFNRFATLKRPKRGQNWTLQEGLLWFPIRFASEVWPRPGLAWPRPGLAEPRSASIAGFGNTRPLASTYYCVESLLLKQNPTMIHLRHAKSSVSRAACKVPHCQKWDCHALPLFALDRVIPRLLSYFNSRQDQKRARQMHTLERVATLFLRLRHDAQNAFSCFKSSPEIMRLQKPKRMTQTSMCWTGEDHLWKCKI